MTPRQSLEKCRHRIRWVKCLLCKPGDLSLVLSTPEREKERTDSIKQCSDRHMCITAHVSVYTSHINDDDEDDDDKDMATTQLRPQELRDAEGFSFGV